MSGERNPLGPVLVSVYVFLYQYETTFITLTGRSELEDRATRSPPSDETQPRIGASFVLLPSDVDPPSPFLPLPLLQNAKSQLVWTLIFVDPIDMGKLRLDKSTSSDEVFGSSSCSLSSSPQPSLARRPFPTFPRADRSLFLVPSELL